MTYQSLESLVYQGRTYLTKTQALEVYFQMGGKRPPIIVNTSMCWRGYAGTWSLDDGRLRLTRLRGLLAQGKLVDIASEVYRHQIEYCDDPGLCRDLVLEDVFPGFPHQVFAHWYSGEIQATAAEDESAGIVAFIDRGRIESIKNANIEEAQT
jgi:hypothetical protein